MRQHTDDDEWFDKTAERSEKLHGNDPDERLRRIAREEADKRINAYLGPLLFLAALWWAHREWGNPGFFAVIALGATWFAWTIYRLDFDPKHERHLIPSHAEDLNRLTVIAEAHEAGEQVWYVREKEYDRDTRKVSAFGGDRWDGSWKRIYGWIGELEQLTPRERRKRLMQAAHRAKPALEEGAETARREKAELVMWARIYLQDLSHD